jgi:hypothetical protein
MSIAICHLRVLHWQDQNDVVPSDFEHVINMALIYGEDVEEDQLEA